MAGPTRERRATWHVWHWHNMHIILWTVPILLHVVVSVCGTKWGLSLGMECRPSCVCPQTSQREGRWLSPECAGTGWYWPPPTADRYMYIPCYTLTHTYTHIHTHTTCTYVHIECAGTGWYWPPPTADRMRDTCTVHVDPLLLYVIHSHTHTCTCTCTRAHTYMYVHIHTYLHVHTHTHTHTHTL